MNLIKLLSTDFFTGQILFSGKGLLDILWFLIRNPQKKISKTRRAHPAADPQIHKGIGEAADKPPSLGTPGLGHGQR